MEQKILTEQQTLVLDLVSKEPELQNFYLSGGTALAAFHLEHRFSDDLDFFTPDTVDIVFLRSFVETIQYELVATTTEFQRLHDRNLFTFMLPDNELKIEFTIYPFPQFENPSIRENIKIDSFRDIAANKLAALLDRFEPKDFADMYFILQKTSLEHVWHDTEKKFGMQIDPMFLGSELAKVRRIEALPRMIKPLTKEELRQFFTEEAKKLSPSILL